MDFEAASSIVAVIAIVVSAVAYREAIRQNRLTASSVSADWLRSILSWASEAVDVLAESTYLCRRGDPIDSDEVAGRLVWCRHRLSALVDRGRFLLPNEREDEVGTHKPDAYRGLRHRALDSLVAADKILGGEMSLCAFPDRKSALIGVRREFVSDVQAIIDPRSVNKDVAAILRLASKSRASDPTVGGLLPDAKKPPPGAQGIVEVASRRRELGG